MWDILYFISGEYAIFTPTKDGFLEAVIRFSILRVGISPSRSFMHHGLLKVIYFIGVPFGAQGHKMALVPYYLCISLIFPIDLCYPRTPWNFHRAWYIIVEMGKDILRVCDDHCSRSKPLLSNFIWCQYSSHPLLLAVTESCQFDACNVVFCVLHSPYIFSPPLIEAVQLRRRDSRDC